MRRMAGRLTQRVIHSATCRFGDLMRVAQKREEEICIGYKLKSLESDADANYGVKLIPSKDSEVTLNEEDGLVVVSEDDR